MNNKLCYFKKAEFFEEALPIGNGAFGAMVYGGIKKDKLSLNHDTLWSGTPKRKLMPNAKEAYKKAKELMKNGDVAGAENEIIYGMHTAWTQNYLPMGTLNITNTRFGNDVEKSDYTRVLDMENGLVNVEFAVNGKRYKREYFVSNPDDCVAVRFSNDEKSDYVIDFESPVKHTVAMDKNMLIIKGECPSNLFPCDRPAEKPCSYDGNSIRFTTVIYVKTDGEVKGEDESLTISSSNSFELYVCTETSFIDHNTSPVKKTEKPCKDKMKKLSEIPYNEIKLRHTEDFSPFYNRTSIDLTDEKKNVDTGEILKDGKDFAYLTELTFNFAKYLYISASREGTNPMALQGIWNESFTPPWCGSYTLNINTEMNYWPAQAFNMAELQTPVLSLAKKLADTGAITAKEYYDADGIVSHHVSDIWGMSTPCGPDTPKSCPWAFWNMSYGWIVNEAYKRYEYTKDIDYLKELYPLMKKASVFCMSILTEYNGKLVAMPGSSPENAYVLNGERFGASPYSAMNQAIIIVLFKNTIQACEDLFTDGEFKEKLKNILPKLYTFEKDSQGRLIEWDKEYEENDVTHRHVSHLYGVYPGELFSEKTDKEMFDASRKSLEIRGDEGTGWSIAWKINLWAKFKEGERSFKLFKDQMRYSTPGACCADETGMIRTEGVSGGTYPNMMCAHPPFQIDGNFGAAMGIIQWIVQCEDDKVLILPAISKELSHGSLKGVGIKGNAFLDIEWQDSKCTKLSVLSHTGDKLNFVVNGKEFEVTPKKDERTDIEI